MGALESTEEYELSPPPPTRSTLFVVRNGRYEPQNLMPVLPRPDMLDFDGFVVRRGAGHGRLNAHPPEMKQERLLKNPVSVRRDSVRVGSRDAVPTPSGQEHDRGETASSAAALEVDVVVASSEEKLPILSFTYDALSSATLTLHLMVTEEEIPLNTEAPAEQQTNEETKGDESPSKPKEPKVKGPSYIKLVPRAVPATAAEDDAFLLTDEAKPPPPSMVHTFRIEKGLGQVYQSAPLDLGRWPADALAFDPSRPKDIPMVVRLEADVEEGEEASIQYSYISLHSSTTPSNAGDSLAQPQWSANIHAQKLQFGSQCFVLRDVFGVTSKIADDVDLEGGNSDCVICLSEPRDTAVLPCRHMCFCSYCAGIVRLQCDRCPVCRQKVQSLLQFQRDQDGQSVDDPLAGPKAMDTPVTGTMGPAAAASASVPGSSSAGSSLPLSSIGPASSSAPMAAAVAAAS